jgi:hypothetical protein
MGGILIALLLATMPAIAAEATRCEKIKAEAAELERSPPKACEESRETQIRYLQAIPEILETCRRLENETISEVPGNGPNAIMELKQKHLTERQKLEEHFAHQLLRTPVDTDDPSRPPAEVSSECGTELENFARFRRAVLRGVAEFYRKFEESDDAAFRKAAGAGS